MAQAIITKFLGPTHTKGARIKATWLTGSVTVDYHSLDGSLNCEGRNRQAAQALIDKINRERNPSAGLTWYLMDVRGLGMPDQTGYAFGIELE